MPLGIVTSLRSSQRHLIHLTDASKRIIIVLIMNITRQADYALRCIMFMAKEPARVFMIKDIASRKLLPQSFLAKILQRLARKGIVKSLRGVKGGFVLTRTPAEITIYDIIEAIDGPVKINKCVLDATACTLRKTCSLHKFWTEIQNELVNKLKNNTIASQLT